MRPGGGQLLFSLLAVHAKKSDRSPEAPNIREIRPLLRQVADDVKPMLAGDPDVIPAFSDAWTVAATAPSSAAHRVHASFQLAPPPPPLPDRVTCSVPADSRDRGSLAPGAPGADSQCAESCCDERRLVAGRDGHPVIGADTVLGQQLSN